MKYTVIGFGGRGCIYSYFFKNEHPEVELVAVCDQDPIKREQAKEIHHLNDDYLFSTTQEFFEKGKLSDVCIIATQDNSHYEIALKALEIGYDLILEKPIADTIEKCEIIKEVAEKLGRNVFVCHVLRYAPFFLDIKKQLETGKYGNVSTINLTENVAYWHQAHSYVRGNWRNKETSTPMIVAKCCHDLDLLVWLIGKNAKYVSSMGYLNLFKKENQPKDAADRCCDCKYKEDCAYSAYKYYLHEQFEKGQVGWPTNVLTPNPTYESVLNALQKGPYGRCVFNCDNNVVDHQITNIVFDNDITAHLTMTAFSKTSYREIHIHCEYGEIFGNMEQNILFCNIFGKESFTIDVNEGSFDEFAGHGGGDGRLISDIVNFYEGKESVGLTTIDKSVESHRIAFYAEESRLDNGRVIDLRKKV